MPHFQRFFVVLLLTLAPVCSLAQAQEDVIIEVDQFGVGSMFRPGDITGVRLRITSTLPEAMPAWVQWEVPNVDGDIGEYGRSLTLTPNVPAMVWLYAPLPPDCGNSTVWTVRAFEERDGQRRGEIGAARIGPSRSSSQLVEPGRAMIAVVGDRRMGLDRYALHDAGNFVARVAHEDTRVALNIRPAQLPDRWFGYLPYEALVWAGDAPPQDLGVEQAKALREWISRGGHFVIVLPADRNTWGLGVIGATQLESILPMRTQGVGPRLDVAVTLADLLPILSKTQDVQRLAGGKFIPDFNIRVFKDLGGDFDVIDNEYQPLIALSDGRVVAIQRIVSHGRVTVIGIDLADGRLPGFELPQPDAFWNRIFGRRADSPTPAELNDLARQNRLAMGNVTERSLGSGALFTSQLDFPSKAGMGLLLAFILFAAYWLLAGPLGFGLLKVYGQVKHSWLAFAACAGIFTAVAWGSVSLLPKRLEVKHVTFLDHIALGPGETRSEPQLQRGVSFLSVLLPNYGTTRIAIDSVEGQRDLLHSWTPPPIPPPQFPNVDRFRVDIAGSPYELSLPARSTATHLYANWLGGVHPEQWGGMLRIDPRDPVRIVRGGSGDELAGSIINELPGSLTNVTMIWVQNHRRTQRIYALDPTTRRELPFVPSSRTGEVLNNSRIWRLPANEDWSTGKAYNLAGATARASLFEIGVQGRYIEEYANRNILTTSLSERNRFDFMEMLTIFQQLNPPEYLKEPNQNLEETAGFTRDLGRELDLSAWFNRPCLIVIGYLEDSACPIPLRIDGSDEPPASSGRTMVRWIYPMPLDENAAFANVLNQPEG